MTEAAQIAPQQALPPLLQAVSLMCKLLHDAGISCDGIELGLPPPAMAIAYDELKTEAASRENWAPLTLRMAFTGSLGPEAVTLRRTAPRSGAIVIP